MMKEEMGKMKEKKLRTVYFQNLEMDPIFLRHPVPPVDPFVRQKNLDHL